MSVRMCAPMYRTKAGKSQRTHLAPDRENKERKFVEGSIRSKQSWGRQGDARGRQGLHHAPCRAPNAAPATQNRSTKPRSPRDAKAYITPLAKHQVPRLPRKIEAQSPGAQGTPRRTSRPLQSTKCRACHANYKQRARSPRDARAYITPLAVPSRAPAAQNTSTKPQRGPCRAPSAHPGPCRAPSAAPATQMRSTEGK